MFTISSPVNPEPHLYPALSLKGRGGFLWFEVNTPGIEIIPFSSCLNYFIRTNKGKASKRLFIPVFIR